MQHLLSAVPSSAVVQGRNSVSLSDVDPSGYKSSSPVDMQQRELSATSHRSSCGDFAEPVVVEQVCVVAEEVNARESRTSFFGSSDGGDGGDGGDHRRYCDPYSDCEDRASGDSRGHSDNGDNGDECNIGDGGQSALIMEPSPEEIIAATKKGSIGDTGSKSSDVSVQPAPLTATAVAVPSAESPVLLVPVEAVLSAGTGLRATVGLGAHQSSNRSSVSPVVVSHIGGISYRGHFIPSGNSGGHTAAAVQSRSHPQDEEPSSLLESPVRLVVLYCSYSPQSQYLNVIWYFFFFFQSIVQIQARYRS